ncbi:MAG: hypothetical protein KA746_14020 [Pyrinomonadaceae bacterium]|nr:hypothetical protein [Pyrinomonadaceae bacterium]MBP6211810.1 hypothetical protein [Pyrinomonadaceae bacterium]
MPFGEDLNVGVGNRNGDAGLKYSMPGDNIRQKFTVYQKDTETSLDFAEARKDCGPGTAILIDLIRQLC